MVALYHHAEDEDKSRQQSTSTASTSTNTTTIDPSLLTRMLCAITRYLKVYLHNYYPDVDTNEFYAYDLYDGDNSSSTHDVHSKPINSYTMSDEIFGLTHADWQLIYDISYGIIEMKDHQTLHPGNIGVGRIRQLIGDVYQRPSHYISLAMRHPHSRPHSYSSVRLIRMVILMEGYAKWINPQYITMYSGAWKQLWAGENGY